MHPTVKFNKSTKSKFTSNIPISKLLFEIKDMLLSNSVEEKSAVSIRQREKSIRKVSSQVVEKSAVSS